MRIAHVTDCYLPRLGGIEMQVRDLAAHQLAAGHEPQILTCTPRPGTRRRDETADPVGAGSVPVLRLGTGLTGMPSMTGLARLRALVRSGEFDAVHAHSSVGSPLAWTAARVAAHAGVPTVLTMHSVVPARRIVLQGAGVVTGLRRAPIVWTAVSEAAASPLRLGLSSQRVDLLPNGIDPGRWRTTGPRPAGSELTIVSVMRLSRRKRPMALLRMLAAIRDLVPATVPIRAVLIGEGPQQPRMARFLAAKNMQDWVTLTGRLSREQIRPLLAAADVYLAPAELESFGIAALEARCAGLPVVAMAGGGVGEFIRPGREGFLVQSDDEMSEVTARLLVSADLARIQRHNRETVPDLAWPRVVALCTDFYRRAGATVVEPVHEVNLVDLERVDEAPFPQRLAV